MLQIGSNALGDMSARLAAVRAATADIISDGGIGDVIIHRGVAGDHRVDEESGSCFCEPLVVPAVYLARMTDYEIARLIAVHEIGRD